MKKILSTIIVITMLISMVGCATKPSTNTKPAETQGQLKQENKFDFDKFQKALEEDGFKVEKGLPIENLVGAVNGYFYKINDVAIEVYKFDLNSKNPLTVENIKMAKESSKIKLDLQQGPLEVPAEINNNLIISAIDMHPDKDKIVKVLKDLK
ncbi:hypothetical protein [Clostridium sp. UBA3061]|uniref:hypothetical protein n=1 Tax=Clostridium sp. UBA3061 TaxID=1946353 RepID=UPI003217D189